ncbi:hypothetical protein AAC387_Pa06g0990 [Persea americana]
MGERVARWRGWAWWPALRRCPGHRGWEGGFMGVEVARREGFRAWGLLGVGAGQGERVAGRRGCAWGRRWRLRRHIERGYAEETRTCCRVSRWRKLEGCKQGENLRSSFNKRFSHD